MQNDRHFIDSHIKWKQVSPVELQTHRSSLGESLRATDYSNVSNVTDKINQRYDNIVTKIISCSDNAFSKTECRRFLKPYWDQNLKDLHAVMRQARRFWISECRPRGIITSRTGSTKGQNAFSVVSIVNARISICLLSMLKSMKLQK